MAPQRPTTSARRRSGSTTTISAANVPRQELHAQGADRAGSDDHDAIAGADGGSGDGVGGTCRRLEPSGRAQVSLMSEDMEVGGRQSQMLGPGSLSGKAGLVVAGFAEHAVSRLAVRADMTGIDAFADDLAVEQIRVDAGADFDDDSGPLVAWNDWVTDEPGGRRPASKSTSDPQIPA